VPAGLTIQDDGEKPPHTEQTTLGQRIAVARREAGLSPQQLATRVGVAPSTIAHIETSMTTPTFMALALARELGVPTEDLHSDAEPAEDLPAATER
jgi:DNA-binding XRE family transcriptional regulator